MDYRINVTEWVRPNRIAELEASLEQARQARDDWRGRYIRRGETIRLQDKELTALRTKVSDLERDVSVLRRAVEIAAQQIVAYMRNAREFQDKAEEWQQKAVKAEKRNAELCNVLIDAGLALNRSHRELRESNAILAGWIKNTVDSVADALSRNKPTSPSGENGASGEPRTTGPCNHSGNGGCGCGPDRETE